MKKLATWALALVFVLSFALPHGTTFAQSDAVKFVVDGVEVEGYEQPFMSHGDVLIPVENLFNEAGFKVSKDKSGKVNVSNSYLTVDFNASAGVIEVNGEKADTEFPLTLKNAGNYVSGEFLASLEGFEVEVSEDQKTVNITTNRVQDVSAFLTKSMASGLNSQTLNLTLDLEMASSLEEESIKMLMDIKSDDILDPLSSHSTSKISTTDPEGNAFEETTETYLTEEGYFEKIGDTWIKYDDSMTAVFQQLATAQEMILPQLEELQQVFTNGLNIYEYEDVYVMTQSLTTEEFQEMLKEASSLLSGLLPVGEVVTEEEATEEEITEEAAIEEAATEEVVTEETTTEEAVNEEVVMEEVDFEALFEELGISIEEFYFVSNYAKDTLFPLDLSGTAHVTATMGEDTISVKLLLNGTFSNFNAVKEIKVPEEVIKNAISMEEYFKQLEAQYEQELEEAAK